MAIGARAVVRRALGRTAVLLVWALAGWGGLLAISALDVSLREGPAAAFARLLPARDASAWDWLAPVCVLLAVGAVLAVATLVVARRWRGTTSTGQ